ncbi:hypothetical protein CR513_57789, partial [Mucuna pruriens]
MSMMGELKSLLGFHVEQTNFNTYIHRKKYAKELLKKFKLDDCKSKSILKHTNASNMSFEVDQTTYRGMITSLLYLIVSTHSIMFSICLCACFQFDLRETHLTISRKKNTSEGYHFIGANLVSCAICDNTVVISLSKNATMDFRAKHIEIKHHFIRDYVLQRRIEYQLVDIFTKPLTKDKLNHI